MATNEYDRIIKENIEAVILPLSNKLFGIRPETMEEITTDLQVTLQRKPDVTRKITDQDGQPRILHIEFQTSNETEMILRMQTYRALLQEVHQLPLRQFVVYLGQKNPTMKTSIAEFIPGDDSNFRYDLINIHHYDYEQLVSSDIPEEILLAILGDFQNESPESVVARILERLLATSQDTLKLQRYVRQLVIMSKLRNLENSTLQNIEKMPIEFDIENDVIYQRGRKEGEERGEERGKKERREEMIIEMLRDGALSTEKIAAYAKVPVEYVQQLRQALNA